jgi:hypothetical protein
VWKLAKHVIQGEFGDSECPKPKGLSHGPLYLVIQPLHDTAGELLFSPKVVED